MLNQPPQTPQSQPQSDAGRPQPRYSRDQIRDVILDHVRAQERSQADLLAFVAGLNNKWAQNELTALLNTRTIRGRVVARVKADGTPDKPLVSYYIE